MEILAISQTPEKDEKLQEYVTIIDPHALQKKACGGLQTGHRTQLNQNLIKSITNSGINSIACSPNYGMFITGKTKPLIYCFDVKSSTVQSQKGSIVSLGSGGAVISNLKIIHDDGVEILVASCKEQLFIWMLNCSSLEHEKNQPELIGTIVRHTQPINFIKVTDNNEYLVTVGLDGFANVYAIFDLLEKGSLSLPLYSMKINELDPAGVNLVNVHSHFLKLITAGGDYKIRVWDLDLSQSEAQNSEKSSWKNSSVICNESYSHDFGVAVRVFCVDNAGLVCYLTLASNDKLPIAFEIRSSKQQNFKNGADGVIQKMEVTCDGRKLVSLEDQAVKVWDTRQRVCLKSFMVKNAESFALFSKIPDYWFDVTIGVGHESLKMSKFLSKQEKDSEAIVSVL